MNHSQTINILDKLVVIKLKISALQKTQLRERKRQVTAAHDSTQLWSPCLRNRGRKTGRVFEVSLDYSLNYSQDCSNPINTSHKLGELVSNNTVDLQV